MRENNLYEDVASQAAQEISAMLPQMIDDVRGGKRPPWQVELSGPKLAEYWAALPPMEKLTRWDQMTPEEQQEVKKVARY